MSYSIIMIVLCLAGLIVGYEIGDALANCRIVEQISEEEEDERFEQFVAKVYFINDDF